MAFEIYVRGMARADTQLFKIVVSTGRKVRLSGDSGLCTLTAQVPPTRPLPRVEGCKYEPFVAMEYKLLSAKYRLSEEV